jgi:phospholipid-binding lipoprotein MlaA
MTHRFRFLSLIALLLTSCSTPNTGPDKDIDPHKAYNQKVFAFNQEVDHYITRPVAIAYEAITPDIVEVGISNVFSNIGMLTTIANDLLQGDLYYAASDSWRFVLNSTFGIGGLFDVATINDFPEHKQYFGITLAKWGFVNSPYLVIPFVGPSTYYDALSLSVDNLLLSPWPYVKPIDVSTGLFVLNMVNNRAKMLPYDQAVLDSFDPYIFVRNAYLQKREKMVTTIQEGGIVTSSGIND